MEEASYFEEKQQRCVDLNASRYNVAQKTSVHINFFYIEMTKMPFYD